MEISIADMNLHHHSGPLSTQWRPSWSTSCSVIAAYFPSMSQNSSRVVFSGKFLNVSAPISTRRAFVASAAALSSNSEDINQDLGEINGGIFNGKTARGSGTTARGRRLLKVREEKRKREYDRLHNYPAWAKVLEDACKNDSELRAVLGDSVGNPELMRKRVEERVRRKGRDFQKSKTGSVVAFKVSFRE